jgi:hypothetical protein
MEKDGAGALPLASPGLGARANSVNVSKILYNMAEKFFVGLSAQP